MKSIVSIITVAIAIAFTAPAFAGEPSDKPASDNTVTTDESAKMGTRTREPTQASTAPNPRATQRRLSSPNAEISRAILSKLRVNGYLMAQCLWLGYIAQACLGTLEVKLLRSA